MKGFMCERSDGAQSVTLGVICKVFCIFSKHFYIISDNIFNTFGKRYAENEMLEAITQ